MSEKKKQNNNDKKGEYFHPLVAVSADENLPAVSNPALHRYLQEISQYELLSREDTEALASRFQETGDPEAAYQLVSANLRLVVKVAMDFQKYFYITMNFRHLGIVYSFRSEPAKQSPR